VVGAAVVRSNGEGELVLEADPGVRVERGEEELGNLDVVC
jgi:hypothetical protein